MDSQPDSSRECLRGIRSFVTSPATGVHRLLSGDPMEAMGEIATHIKAVNLEPDGQVYRAADTSGLHGVLSEPGGAGGPECTVSLRPAVEFLAEIPVAA